MAAEAPFGTTAKPGELRVLVLPSTAADAQAISRVLGANGIASKNCSGISQLCMEHEQGAGLLIVSEEALPAGADELAACVAGQPVWSDLPVMVLSKAGRESHALADTVARLGNVSVIERPVRTSTLLSLVRSGLRARERQYQVREYLAAQELAQQVIREGERRYRSLIENVTDYAIFMTDPAGRINSWNSGAESILGYGSEEVLGQSMDMFSTAGHLADGGWIRRKDGKDLFIDTASAPVTDDGGRLVGYAHFLKDVTEKHRIETEREELLQSERAARGEAERASRMKEEFLATLSHELRTPLNAVLGWARLLRKSRDLSEDAMNGLTVIERNARSQGQIIDDLLDMSAIISGKVRLEVEPVDLASLVSTAIETIRPAAQARDIQLEVVLDPSPALVRGDPYRLQQVLWNLLSNAVKFTPKDGRITITLARVHSHLEVEVTDNGEGIDAAFLPYVFDRFRQADASSSRPHGGLGLGLSIVKQLVELHGGSIAATSAGRGQGARFHIEMPLLAAVPDAQRTEALSGLRMPAAELAVQDESPALDLKGLKILVVDDEPDARFLVQRILADCNAGVTTASSAGEALGLLAQDPPDVLISDVGMPGEDGYALIRRVRLLPNGSSRIPAIALTAYARKEDRAKAKRAGFQRHLAKPVDATELVATVDSLARPSSA